MCCVCPDPFENLDSYLHLSLDHIVVGEEGHEARTCCTECYAELMALQEHMRSNLDDLDG